MILAGSGFMVDEGKIHRRSFPFKRF